MRKMTALLPGSELEMVQVLWHGRPPLSRLKVEQALAEAGRPGIILRLPCPRRAAPGTFLFCSAPWAHFSKPYIFFIKRSIFLLFSLFFPFLLGCSQKVNYHFYLLS